MVARTRDGAVAAGEDAPREGLAEDLAGVMSGEVLPAEVSPVIAAEINQQVATARRYPRRAESVISDEIRRLATLSDQVAAECMYSLKRADKAIIGPSIRFAEIVRSAFGNMRVAARFVMLDTADPSRAAVVVEAVAFDVQNNNAEIIPVRRSIVTSASGGRAPRIYSADMINTTMMAAIAIARRNAILALVPKALWLAGYQRAVAVIQGSVENFAERLDKVMAAFAKAGATEVQVLGAIDVRDRRDVTVEHLPAMFGYLNAIHEGETVASVLGRAGSAEPGHEVVKDPLKDEAPAKAAVAGPPGGAPTAQGQPSPATQVAQDALAEPGGHTPTGDGATANLAAAPAARDPAPETTEQAKPAQAGPMTNDQYVEASVKFIAGQKSVTGLVEWWKRERVTREERKLTPDQLGRLTAARDARRAEIEAA